MAQQSQQAKPQMESWLYDRSKEQSKKYYQIGYDDGFRGNCVNEELECDLDYIEGWSMGFSDRCDANKLMFD